MTHTCISKLTISGSDTGLPPGRRQAIIWTSAGILLIGPLGTNFGENLIEIYTFSIKKMHWKMSSGKWWPFCLSLNVLTSQFIWVSWHLKSLATQLFLQQLVQADIKETIEFLHLGLLWREPQVTGRSPSQRLGHVESVSTWLSLHHHEITLNLWDVHSSYHYKYMVKWLALMILQICFEPTDWG